MDTSRAASIILSLTLLLSLLAPLAATIPVESASPGYPEAGQGQSLEWYDWGSRFVVWLGPSPVLGPGDVQPDREPLSIEQARSLVESMGGVVVSEMPIFNVLVIEAEYSVVERLRSLGASVVPDFKIPLIEPVSVEEVKPLLNVSIPSIGADKLHSRGITGRGVIVAILDSGIENRHPAFYDPSSPTGSAVVWEFDATQTGVNDLCGTRIGQPSAHGTHVAGIVASRDQTYKGVAPGAMLYDIILFTDLDGCRGSSFSWILMGLQAALLGPDGQPGTSDDADIVNMSLGSRVAPWAFSYTGPDVERTLRGVFKNVYQVLMQYGVLVVVSAGNSGPGLYTSNVLCIEGLVLCVAASGDKDTPSINDDSITFFSSRGPHSMLEAPGPTITAPGENIIAPIPRALGASFAAFSGTSMAAPHVSGALALLIQGLEGLNISKNLIPLILASTAVDVGSSNQYPGATPIEQGSGLIQVDKALDAGLVLASTSGYPYVSLMLPQGRSASETIVVANISGSPASFTVQGFTTPVSIMNRNNTSYPSLQASPSQGTLQPGQAASITVSVDASGAMPGLYTSYLVVAQGNATYRIPVMVAVAMELNPDSLAGTTVTIELDLGRGFFDTSAMPIYIPQASSTIVEFKAEGPFRADVVVQGPDQNISRWALIPDQAGYYILYLTVLTPVLAEDYLPMFVTIPTGIGFKIVASAAAAGGGGDVGDLELRVSQLERDVSSLRGEVSQLSDRVLSLERTLSSLSATVDTLQSTVSNLQGDVDFLAQEVSRLDRGVSDLQQELSRLDRNISDLRSRILQLEGAIDNINFAIDSLSRRADSLESRIEDLEFRLSAVDNINSQLESIKGELSLVKSRLDQIQSQVETSISSINSQLDQANAKISSLERELSTLSASLDEAQRSSRDLQGLVETLERTVRNLSAEVENTTTTINRVQIDIQQASATLATVQQDLATIESKVAQLESSVEQSRPEIQRIGEKADSSSGRASLAIGLSSISLLLAIGALGLGAIIARKTLLS